MKKKIEENVNFKVKVKLNVTIGVKIKTKIYQAKREYKIESKNKELLNYQ